MRSGFVAIIGKPNVGKSSILNAIIGGKCSIVTDKAQTTRNSITGIYNEEDYQIVFVDTPGLHEAQHSLGKYMNQEAINSVKGVEAVVLVVDSSKDFSLNDERILDACKNQKHLFVVLNKIDLIKLPTAEALKAKYKETFPQANIIETSALDNFNIDYLINSIKNILPEGPQYYSEDQYIDKDSKFIMSEIIREKLLKALKQEIPHQLAVSVEKIESHKNDLHVFAKIIVDKESHKGIVIGAGGKRLKTVGKHAREDIEKLFDKHVYLELFVSVKEDWLNNGRLLKELGYK